MYVHAVFHSLDSVLFNADRLVLGKASEDPEHIRSPSWWEISFEASGKATVEYRTRRPNQSSHTVTLSRQDGRWVVESEVLTGSQHAG